MIALNYPQGSIEWILARLWRLTASAAKSNITAKGDLSKSQASLKAIDKLIAGIDVAHIIREIPEVNEMDDYELQNFLADFTGDKFKGSVHTLRGNTYEHIVMAELSEAVGEQFQPIGMCVMGDNENNIISCSPDGYTQAGGKMKAGGEVKCPALATYNGYIVEKVLPPDYELQVNFSMAVCDVDVWHFGAKFVNKHIQKPLLHIPVRRSAYTDKVQDSLIRFKELYRERYEAVHAGIDSLTKATPSLEVI